MARLFTAIEMSEPIKGALLDTIDWLRMHSTGSFTRPENLHLTLAFIGETGNVDGAVAALEEVYFPPIQLRLGKLGVFKRAGGDIVWAGIEGGDELLALSADICSMLGAGGFYVEKRAFKAHVTLARQAYLRAPLPAIPRLAVTAEQVVLFESKRLGARLIYEPLHVKRCNG